MWLTEIYIFAILAVPQGSSPLSTGTTDASACVIRVLTNRLYVLRWYTLFVSCLYSSNIICFAGEDSHPPEPNNRFGLLDLVLRCQSKNSLLRYCALSPLPCREKRVGAECLCQGHRLRQSCHVGLFEERNEG